MRNKTAWVMGILVILVLVLGTMVLYSYFGKPYFLSYSNKIYTQGANDALTVLINQVQARGYAEIPLTNSQTLILVPVQQASASVSTSQGPAENSSG